MAIEILPDAPPLRQDGSGAVRIGDTRVLLELVIGAFREGATPEAIVQRYPTTNLAQIYAVVAYYLRHRDVVERYLSEREQAADALRKRIESAQPDMRDIRARLLARRAARG